jgi:hypothetical protein
MWAIVHRSKRVNYKPLTPEELKVQEKTDLFMGGLILVTTILFFCALIWALIVS